MILSQSVVADVIPARERGKYMGIIGGGLRLLLGRRAAHRRVDHRKSRLALGILA